MPFPLKILHSLCQGFVFVFRLSNLPSLLFFKRLQLRFHQGSSFVSFYFSLFWSVSFHNLCENLHNHTRVINHVSPATMLKSNKLCVVCSYMLCMLNHTFRIKIMATGTRTDCMWTQDNKTTCMVCDFHINYSPLQNIFTPQYSIVQSHLLEASFMRKP